MPRQLWHIMVRAGVVVRAGAMGAWRAAHTTHTCCMRRWQPVEHG
jgi:hypothetical protein